MTNKDKFYALVFAYGQLDDGSIDDQTTSRCNQVLKLYKKRLLKKIFITASAAKNGISLATSMRNYLLDSGVHTFDIVIDPRGENTTGEIDVFLSHVPSRSRVIFISSWYHIPRIIWLSIWRVPLLSLAFKSAWRKACHLSDIKAEVYKFLIAFFAPYKSSRIIEENIKSSIFAKNKQNI